MKRKWMNRVSSVLAVAMLFGALPTAALATEPEQPGTAVEAQEEEVQEEGVQPQADTADSTVLETTTIPIDTNANDPNTETELGYKFEGAKLTVLNDNYNAHAGDIVNNTELKATFTEVVVCDGVTSLTAWAFQGLGNVTAITLPDSLTTINACAFEWMSSITEITLPKNVATIGDSVFNGCGSLTKIKGYNDVAKNYAAAASIAYENLSTPAAEDKGYTYEGSTLTITSNAYANTLGEIIFNDGFKEGLTKVVVQEGVTALPDFAFQNLAKVTEIILAESLTTIGKYAFENIAITEITIPAAATTIGENVFNNCAKLATVKGYTAAAKAAAEAAGKSYEDLTPAKVEQLGSPAVELAQGAIAVKLPVEIKGDKAQYNVKFTKAGVDAAAETAIQGEANAYYVTCPIAAHQMTEEITAQLYYKADANTAETVVGEPANFTLASLLAGDLTPQQAALLNYGGYAQLAFGHKTDALANAALTDAQKSLDAVTAQTVQAYKPTVECEDESYRVTATLTYGAAPALTLTINGATELTAENVTVTVKKAGETDEIANKAVDYKDGILTVNIKDIPLAEVDTLYAITLTDAKTGTQIMAATYGVYSYVYDQLKPGAQPGQLITDLAKATYLFYNSCKQAG